MFPNELNPRTCIKTKSSNVQSLDDQRQYQQWHFKVNGSPSKLIAPSVILVSLEPPLTPDGVSGRISGTVDGTTNACSPTADAVYFPTPL